SRPLMVGIASDASAQALHHGHCVGCLADRLEAETLVPRGLVPVRAETDRLVAVVTGTLEQRLEQLLPGAFAAVTRHDGDGELRRLLVDEAESRLVGREDAVPGGPVRVRALEREHARVARTAPVAHVAIDGPLRIFGDAPVIRVAQHVAEEAHVALVHGSLHHSSWASCTRLPSGSSTSSSRISPPSSSTIPTSTPSERSRSASAFTSSTSTCATPPSDCGSPSASPISIAPRRSWDQRLVKSTAV